MSTKDAQDRLRWQRIEGVRTLQDLGTRRDSNPVAEEEAQLGVWPAGSISQKMQEVGLSSMDEKTGSEVLTRAVHEESVSLRLERDRGVSIADELEERSVYAREPVGVKAQGSRLKTASLKSFWDNREELIETVRSNKVFQLGARGLDALVALDDDGRIAQMLGDPRAKLAIMAAKELNAGINNKPEASRIAKMLSGEKEATQAVIDTATDFVPRKLQPAVRPVVKAAQAAAAVGEKMKSEKTAADDISSKLNTEIVKPEGKAPTAESVQAKLGSGPGSMGANFEAGAAQEAARRRAAQAKIQQALNGDEGLHQESEGVEYEN